MSTYNSTLWTCDRCGAKAEMGAREGRASEQPVRWAALHLVVPPLMNPTESDQRPEQICGDCRDSFDKWFSASEEAKP